MTELIPDGKFRPIIEFLAQKAVETASTQDLEEAYYLQELESYEDFPDEDLITLLTTHGRTCEDFK